MSEFQSGKREGYIYGYIGVQPHAHQANKNKLPQNNKNKLGYHKKHHVFILKAL
ncbi:hypothetical protein OWO94_25325 [Bacillus paranthracis]|uniref:hypothetical protein n=1 Tax=Bacillus paranthracis TaxID=2026186 RepID=UPI0025519F54|nr:hypothetical protein [Bacillus paranthracis]MDK7541570.1 hypothetical protein [Bacillus paranthracis]MDK7563323.1 hypothetical protein [Bacillus paranthracis]